MISRPNWDDYFLSIAKAVSSRASCLRASVGVVIVSMDHHILSTGYNGAAPGEKHCTDLVGSFQQPEPVGCLIEDDHCQRTLHAETNAIAWAARKGVALDNSKLYLYYAGPEVVVGPCRECQKVMKAANIVDWIMQYERQD